MLPSFGLLRNAPCPYFVAGLCDRPHCYFSHAKRDITASRNNAVNKQENNTARAALHDSEEKKELNIPSTSSGNLESHPRGSEKAEGSKNSLVSSDHTKRRRSEEVLGIESKRLKLEPVAAETLNLANPSNKISIESSKSKVSRHSSIEKRSDAGAPGEVSRKEKHSENSINSDKHSHRSKDKSTLSNHKHSSRHDSKSRHSHGHNNHKSIASKSGHDGSKSNDKSSSTRKAESSRSKSEKDHHSSHGRHGSNKNSSRVSLEDESKVETHPASNSNPSDSALPSFDFEELSTEFLLPEDNCSDDDPTEIALECLEMFNSYEETKPVKPESSNGGGFKSTNLEKSLPESSTNVLGKKRVAHPGAETHTPSSSPTKAKPKVRASPAEIMQQRYHAAQEKMSKERPAEQESKSAHVPQKPGRQRISHVANVSSLLKPKVSGPVVESERTGTAPLVIQTVQKGQTRVAHAAPKVLEKSVNAPLISIQSIKSSKVPTMVRQRILDQLFQECLKIYPDHKDASARALSEETDLVGRCTSRAVYLCAGTNSVARLRREASQNSSNNCEAPTATSTISHQSIINGSSGAKVSWSIESTKKTSSGTLTGPQLYQRMKKHVLSSSDLESNGYPRFDPSEEKGKAIAKPRTMGCPLPSGKTIHDPFERTCERCKKVYKVNLEGFPLVEDQCVYHQGRKYSKRIGGIQESFYNCCSGDASAPGCAVGNYHVAKNPSGEMRGFMTAIKSNGDDESMGKDPWDIVAIDCEMIYTTNGSELARATFVGSDLKLLYDELVRPIHPILDYNTRYSGITEEMLRDTKTTLTDVQAVMLTHLKPNSILIGHSLESDLIALKLVHNYAVDTSVMFPHKMGPPYKRALRNLSSEFIKKIIQENEGGHDSAEDARTAMELVIWKINEEIKIQDSTVSVAGKRRISATLH